MALFVFIANSACRLHSLSLYDNFGMILQVDIGTVWVTTLGRLKLFGGEGGRLSTESAEKHVSAHIATQIANASAFGSLAISFIRKVSH